MACDTLEIRWFWPELESPALRKLLERISGREPYAEKPRTDHYLRLPNTDSIGIKIRGGRLEHKWRIGSMDARLPEEAGSAAFGNWRKIGFSLHGAERDDCKADWIDVHKRRWISAWQWDGSGPEAVDENVDDRETRCDIELSELNIRPQSEVGSNAAKPLTAWSLCFESEGADREKLLRALLGQFIDAGLSKWLREARCVDYPAWLRSIASVAAFD